MTFKNNNNNNFLIFRSGKSQLCEVMIERIKKEEYIKWFQQCKIRLHSFNEEDCKEEIVVKQEELDISDMSWSSETVTSAAKVNLLNFPT